MLTNSKESFGERGVVDIGSLADGDSTRRRNPILWLFICGILLIAAIAVGTAMMVRNFRDHAIESSKRELENAVVLLSRHFDQQLDDAEVPLVDLIEQARQDGINSPEDFKRRMSTPEMHRELVEKVSHASKVAGINIYDADGVLINSSETESVPNVRIDDRAYFKALRSSTDPAQPQMELVLSRFTHVWKTLLTRKVVGQDGQFLGVVSRAIAPAKFEEFFSAVALGKDATISMHHHGGKLIARYPHVEAVIGKDFRTDSTPEAAAFLKMAHGTTRLFSPIDNAERLVSIQSLSRFPLSVVATTTVEASLADWRAQTKFLVVAAILSVIIIAVTILLIVRRLTLQHQFAQQRVNLEKQRLDTAVENMVQGLTLFDRHRRLVVRNQRYLEMYNLSPDVVKPGCYLHELIAHRNQVGLIGVDVDQYCAKIVDHAARGETVTLRSADGGTFQIRHRSLPDGGWVATHEDITERSRQENAILQQASELARINMQFDAALGNMAQGLCMFDGEKRLVVWNERYAKLYQLSPDLLKVGTTHEAIIADRVLRGILKGETSASATREKLASLNQLPKDTASSRVDEFADGRFILVTRQPMADGGWLATHEDITERRRAEAEIVHLARHDALTGLANRAEFNVRLDEACKRLKRSGGTVTVMMVDLDKFKGVNDTFGHPAGDALLIEVGRRLRSTVRESDVVARLGGDEFAIIQEGGADPHEGAIALALRIIGAISKPFDLNGSPAQLGTSIGIVLAPEHEIDPEGLLKRADLALYDAKSNGRNDYRFFREELLEVARTQRTAESELREAIEREDFELYYQPVVDAKTRTLCGVEALVRWKHPTKGLIAPDKFVPLAETTGLIGPLGEWILRRACADAAAWPAHIKLAVNISAIQFKKGNLFEVILRTLMETGLSPERLELEITETSLLENQEAHLTTIRQLKNLGISMALDDFGTGYSSVNYLANFPFDKIKIDKSFTQGVLSRRDCKAVVASTLALAQGLGTVTTAEGVETEEQLEYMRAAGVDLVQGYLFGRPAPLSQLDLDATPALKVMVA
ncbi:bifunctional diguanylate cyclase/phosphodiesterase [Bradyrhizobium sp.]|uniref:bifunctional diguanylate cyclase/phosphodiesterase n=1 Tax=Bradyrhizobium sp. TaxID=376 RepID=UPI002D253C42|nr:EAL domain-containing protein [Bradyrhizobium sp.]HZR72081.1 EAL domain-containing protein [Bradyrhizobium sp.]